jgi:hypothetical protein
MEASARSARGSVESTAAGPDSRAGPVHGATRAPPAACPKPQEQPPQAPHSESGKPRKETRTD